MDSNQTTASGAIRSAGRRRRPLKLAGLVAVLAMVTSACTPAEISNFLNLLSALTGLLAIIIGGGAPA